MVPLWSLADGVIVVPLHVRDERELGAATLVCALEFIISDQIRACDQSRSQDGGRTGQGSCSSCSSFETTICGALLHACTHTHRHSFSGICTIFSYYENIYIYLMVISEDRPVN